MSGFRGAHEIIDLAGDFHFRHAVIFDHAETLEAARRHLRRPAAGRRRARRPVVCARDPVEQYLMLSGTTFFMGLQFGDLRRLQLDIETYISPGFEFPTAAREGDRIIAIALSDSDGFERVLRGDEMDERAMLEELVQIVRERDPDVIEGHNLFRFDLEYLEERARRHRVKLALGRDGSGLRGRPSRLQIAERSIAFRRYDIYGRSIIDTWILAQHYDIASRELESFGLKDLAIHFGLARADRVYLDAGRVSEHFEQRPAELFAYATRRRARDARAGGSVVAELLRAGADFSVLVPERGVARECDENQRAVDAGVPRRAPFDSRADGADRSARRLYRSAALRRRAQRAALRRDLAVSIADDRGPASAGVGSAWRVSENADRPAQLPRAGQGRGARTDRRRAARPRGAAADLQDSDQFVLRLSGFCARPFQRLRDRQRGHEPRARIDHAGDGGTRRRAARK